jgi:hypothetical protein
LPFAFCPLLFALPLSRIAKTHSQPAHPKVGATLLPSIPTLAHRKAPMANSENSETESFKRFAFTGLLPNPSGAGLRVSALRAQGGPGCGRAVKALPYYRMNFPL